jgi:hypothetical protein
LRGIIFARTTAVLIAESANHNLFAQYNLALLQMVLAAAFLLLIAWPGYFAKVATDNVARVSEMSWNIDSAA